jgi:hypothetical protein
MRAWRLPGFSLHRPPLGVTVGMQMRATLGMPTDGILVRKTEEGRKESDPWTAND